MIHFVDLIKQQKALKKDISDVINDVISRSHFILGKEVQELEKILSEYVGNKCISVANGTDALLVALMAIGVKQDDEVLVPSFTWVSTAEVVCMLKAKPVFIDIDENFNIDLNKIEEKITKKTKAIIPVSMFGSCPELKNIKEISDKYNLKCIEDAAQSFGAKSSGKLSCSVLDISTTSFFPAKPLGCYGDGGAIFTNDDDLFERIKVIPRHGQKGRYQYHEVGINSRLDTIQAAILIEKMKIFEDEINSRIKIAKKYEKLLNDIDLIKTPYIPDEDNRSVWAQYTLILDKKLSEERESLMEDLLSKGIPTALYYPRPLHTSPVYEAFNSTDLNNTNNISSRVLSLPMHPYLTDDDINLIAFELEKSIKKIL